MNKLISRNEPNSIDKKYLTEYIELIVPLIEINKSDGSILFKIDVNKLTDDEAILLYLITSNISSIRELRREEGVKAKELADYFGKPPSIIFSRLSDLKKEKKIYEIKDGMYVVDLSTLKEDILKIMNKLKIEFIGSRNPEPL